MEKLCEDCNDRLEKNPLRILDCKIDAENDILKEAPRTLDYLNEESLKRFEQLKKLLDSMNIRYEVDTKLVRGLDYYNHTVFEVVVNDSYALGGGGRYNGLVETLGGPSIPAVGFAMGYDRTLLALEENGIEIPVENNNDVYVLYVSPTEKEKASVLVQYLRLSGFVCETDLMSKSLKGQFKSVDRFHSMYLIILNDDDLKKGEVVIKNNHTREETRLKITDLVQFLDDHLYEDCECEECHSQKEE